MRMRRLPRREGDERGFTIIVIALTMTIIVTMAAIVIDLGNTYATHRQVQNAVDAATMAGVRQLAKGATGATIAAAVQTEISNNGADVGTIDCRIIANTAGFPFVTLDGEPLTCAEYTNRTDYPTADGVWVNASKTNTALFGGIVSSQSLKTGATAAATAQPLTSINVPLFAACGDDLEQDMNGSNNPPPYAPPLLLDANGHAPDPTTNPSPTLPFHINTAAIYSASADNNKGGPVYEVSGAKVDSCGAGSNSNKGLLQPPVYVWGASPPSSASAWNDVVNTGLKTGAVRPVVANQPGCNLSSSVGCVMAFPICDSAVGTGSGVVYRCEFFGSFQIVKANSNTDDVIFLGQADQEAAYGQGSYGVPQTDQEYVTKIVM